MKHSDPEERLISAKAAVRQAVRSLVHPTPEALDQAEALLRQAHGWLRSAVNLSGQPSAEAWLWTRQDLLELKRLLLRVCGLLDHAAGFYAGWLSFRNTLAGGYTAQGGPAEALSGNRLSLEA